MGESHARQVLAAYQTHYNEHGLTRPATSYRQTFKNTPERCTILTSLAVDLSARGSPVGVINEY
ncbi:hypothetical protein [Lentzea tibetensis]|uniref:hypothetical protein n=1 Tax=Lentzea tibetensis TaxID=2591470 RepID=UPI001F25E4A2|nr:hypothetical protein [Lentzea tibetensis]